MRAFVAFEEAPYGVEAREILFNARGVDSPAIGVAGSPRASIPVPSQIEYDPLTKKGEGIGIRLRGNVNRASFKVSRLFSSEGGGEQGIWVAFLNDHPVAKGLFVLNYGHTGEFHIDTDDVVFNSVVFKATSYRVPYRTADSSDFYLDGFKATGSALINSKYVASSKHPLTVPVDHGVLKNDRDPDEPAEKFWVTQVEGTPLEGRRPIRTESGAMVRMSRDGSFEFLPNGAFDHLPPGSIEKVRFDYTIKDESGATDTAVVEVVVTVPSDRD